MFVINCFDLMLIIRQSWVWFIKIEDCKVLRKWSQGNLVHWEKCGCRQNPAGLRSLDSFRSNEILREIWRCVVPFRTEVNSIVRNRIIRVARSTFRPEMLRSESAAFLFSFRFLSLRLLAKFRKVERDSASIEGKGRPQALPFKVANVFRAFVWLNFDFF